MNILIITDKDINTECSMELYKNLLLLFSNESFQLNTVEISEKDLASCIGCFGCWIKTPGQCVINDYMSNINRKFATSDLVIYFTPVIFGQFSANIKNAVDRWLPNVLPFFDSSNGTTKHPKRYEKYPIEIIIGYSDNITEDEKNTFLNINNEHKIGIKEVFLSLTKENNKDIIKGIKKYIK